MRWSTLFLLLAALVYLGGCSKEKEDETARAADNKQPRKAPYVMKESRTVYTKSTKDITRLFNDINYSVARWQGGNYEIPRIYLTDISSRWGKQAPRIPVKTKKAIFFQLTLPLILRSNEMILENRYRLLDLVQRFGSLSKDEKQWLHKMAKRYKINKRLSDPVTSKTLDELKLRMNVIPPSLALAQAAEESGWGTSRFAMLGNSLFGQWDFSGNAMVPEEQRKELGNYGLKRFDTPLDAVRGYMLNLNSHRAYKRLRLKRAELEAKGEPVTGHALAQMLDKYSERGYAYVESLHTMMSYNQLAHADEAYLWDGETIFLTPLPDPKPVKKKVATTMQPAESNATQKKDENLTARVTPVDVNLTQPPDVNATEVVSAKPILPHQNDENTTASNVQ